MYNQERNCHDACKRVKLTRGDEFAIVEATLEHTKLLKLYYSYLAVCDRDARSAAVPIVDRLVNVGVLSFWGCFEDIASDPQIWKERILDTAFIYLHESFKVHPALESHLIDSLALLSALRATLEVYDRGSVLEWALQWNREAANRLSDGAQEGSALARLSGLVPSNLERLSLLARASFCKYPYNIGDELQRFFANYDHSTSSLENDFIQLQHTIFICGFEFDGVLPIPATLTNGHASKLQGIQIALISVGSILHYGDQESYFYQLYINKKNLPRPSCYGAAEHAAFSIMSGVLEHPFHDACFPYVHIMLAFICCVANNDEAVFALEEYVPWGQICDFLNCMALPEGTESRYCTQIWSRQENLGVLLTEEIAMVGQDWFECHPHACYRRQPQGENECDTIEMSSYRRAAIFWFASQITDVYHSLPSNCGSVTNTATA